MKYTLEDIRTALKNSGIDMVQSVTMDHIIKLIEDALNMKKYNVTFTKYYNYTVLAENEDEARSKAEKQLDRDQSYPTCVTGYDDCDVECLDEEDEDEE